MMTARLAKNNALKAIHNTVELEELVADNPETVEDFTSPIVTQNAPEGMTLDLGKQYKRRVDFCDRALMRIHDPSLHVDDQGSADRGLVYVDFQAGMFEAMKINFLKCISSDFGIVPIAKPKVELYDQAEERICLDLQMKIKDYTHSVKVKVYNTKCSLDVQGFNDKKNKHTKRFEHLNNRTVGEYFAEEIISKVVATIDANVDISKLNSRLKVLASEGRKAAKSKQTHLSDCKVCGKGLKNKKSTQCSLCSDHVHSECLAPKALKCGQCMVYSNTIENDNNHSKDDSIEALKKDIVLPVVYSSANPETIKSPCKAVTHKDDDATNVVSDNLLCQALYCNGCGNVFKTESELKSHESNCHMLRGTKRNRADTSLPVEPAKPCSLCQETVGKIKRLEEEKLITNTAYTQLQNELEAEKQEVRSKNDQIESLKIEISNLKASHRSEAPEVEAYDALKEENKVIKQMVIEKDQTLVKLKDSHEREVAALKIQIKAADEALDCATRENTKMRDKESTLMDIFKSMKKVMDNHQENVTTVPATNVNPFPHVFTCDVCTKRFDSKNDLDTHKLVHLNIFKCEHCDFQDRNEENINNHMIATHCTLKCHICSFVANEGKSLDEHLENVHYSKKFHCTECDSLFHTERMFNEHTSKHRTKDLHCDYCGFRTQSFSNLDYHISRYHKISQGSNSISPVQQDSYSERTKQGSRLSFSLEERLRNGPCLDWMENHCRYGDHCKFAHVKLCRYQESCRSQANCHFYHFNQSNRNFLSQSRPKSYSLNPREFPPLQRRSQVLRRKFPVRA